MMQTRLSSSFRDPQGFMFESNGVIYRQIESTYRTQYEKLLDSGLYGELVNRNLLVSHEEIARTNKNSFKIIAPERIPFISYPYEWSFSQLKEAALLTLQVAETAMEHGMVLKDASAYNVQFQSCRPVFIDTLSFDIYEEGSPWLAYRQFCQHFLAPLILMSKFDLRANKLLHMFIDGVPLDMACKMAPFSALLKPSHFVHLFLHARAQQIYSGESLEKYKKRKFNKQAFTALLDNLKGCISQLEASCAKSSWSDYYNNNNYSRESISEKEKLLRMFILQSRENTVWDFGSNTGHFSRLAADLGKSVISMDMDPLCVELNYRKCRSESKKVLPLVMDLTSPSPAIGWDNKERFSLLQRGPAPLGLALALIHHLAIGNNVPLHMVASFFAGACKKLIIEFIPKEDSQVQRMLASRADIFDKYTEETFLKEFSRYYQITYRTKLSGSQRSLYFMEQIDSK